jgi:ABC-type transporter Mla subunit MlaD
MTDQEFERHALRVVASQEKLVNTLHGMFEVVDGLTDQLKGFRECLTALRDVLDSHHDTSKALIDSHQIVLKAFSDSSVEIGENTEQVRKLISKVESYFGSDPGLEYDN